MLEKSRYYPGVALVLGSLLWYTKSEHSDLLHLRVIAPSHLCEAHILDDKEISEIHDATFH